MPRADCVGIYSGHVTSHKVERKDPEGIQFIAKCELTGWYDKDTKQWKEINTLHETAYLTLVSKGGKKNENQVDSLKSAFGWDGESLRALHQMDVKEIGVSFSVKQSLDRDQNPRYGDNGEPIFSIQWINPMGGLRPVSAADLDAMEDQWKSLSAGEDAAADAARDDTDSPSF